MSWSVRASTAEGGCWVGLAHFAKRRAWLGQRLLHERDRRREVGHDECGVQTQHAPAEGRESAVAALISAAAASVTGAVDFDDEARRGCGEVGDEATGERDLAAKLDAELASRKRRP